METALAELSDADKQLDDMIVEASRRMRRDAILTKLDCSPRRMKDVLDNEERTKAALERLKLVKSVESVPLVPEKPPESKRTPTAVKEPTVCETLYALTFELFRVSAADLKSRHNHSKKLAGVRHAFILVALFKGVAQKWVAFELDMRPHSVSQQVGKAKKAVRVEGGLTEDYARKMCERMGIDFVQLLQHFQSGSA